MTNCSLERPHGRFHAGDTLGGTERDIRVAAGAPRLERLGADAGALADRHSRPRPPMLKLLVVEDDRMFAELIRRGLSEEGYSVDVACDVAEGRMLAFVHEYNAILLDVVLPD